MSSDRYDCPHTPMRFGEWAYFDSFDAHAGKAAALALATARRLVSGEIRYLLLSGPPGSGKTHLATAVANEIADALWRSHRQVKEALAAATDPAERAHLTHELTLASARIDDECPRWLSIPTFLPRLRREIAAGRHGAPDEGSAEWDLQDVVEHASSLLVLDDLGAERATEWSLATLFEPVAARYDDRHGQVLVTSNLSTRELVAAGYGRLVSRLQDEGVLLEMQSARDYRARLRKPLALPVAEAPEVHR